MLGPGRPRRARPARRSTRASRSPASSSTASGAVDSGRRPAPGDIEVERGGGRRRPVDRRAVGAARPAARVDVHAPDGGVARDGRCGPTGTCRRARSRSSPDRFRTAGGALSPVLHVDSDSPLHDDDGRLLTDEPWGIYVKPDRDSVQGGAEPLQVGPSSRSTPIPPARSPRTSPTGGARRSRTAWALRGRPRPLPAGPLGRGRRLHRPTTSRSSTACAPTCTWPRTPTTATR